MLTLEGLMITIGRDTPVRDASLTVRPGECVALVGASGSGKSLTAAALGGHLPPRAHPAGSLSVDGTSVDLTSRRRAGVVSVRQDSLTSLHPLVRLDRQLLPAVRAGRGKLSSSEAMGRVRELLSDVGFPDPDRILRSHPMELSGGQRQRVCLVQALATAPRFVVADEPTTALDPVSTSLVLPVLRRAASEGAGVLFITHDLAAAASLCSRAVVLADGVTTAGGAFVPAGASVPAEIAAGQDVDVAQNLPAEPIGAA